MRDQQLKDEIFGDETNFDGGHGMSLPIKTPLINVSIKTKLQYNEQSPKQKKTLNPSPIQATVPSALKYDDLQDNGPTFQTSQLVTSFQRKLNTTASSPEWDCFLQRSAVTRQL